MEYRPNIKLQPNVENNVFELLNQQAGFDPLTPGVALRIQNKAGVPIFVHETDGPTSSFDGGEGIYYTGWTTDTDENAPGVKITFKGKSEITVGVKVL